MKQPQNTIDRFRRPDSPCRTCIRSIGCNIECTVWIAWFSERWQKMQEAVRAVKRRR